MSLFSAYFKTINQLFAANKERLSIKLKESSRSTELDTITEQLMLIKDLIDTANIGIEAHNTIAANFNTEKTDLIADVWKFLVEENKSIISDFIKKSEILKKSLTELDGGRQKLLDDYNKLDAEIKAANKNVTSVQPSVDAINDTLVAYGFDNFKIVPSKTEPNQYQIEREDSSIAEKTLSEGEVTFITFLYFLQIAKGSLSANSISEERILVVDDPISSLDSTVLFVVSSLLKEIIKEVKKGNGHIKQIILFTHNVYFHKEVTYSNSRSDKKKPDNNPLFWILRKNNNISSIQSYENKNPIRGSYELLWDELKRADGLSGTTMQNTMRRILETYFKTMGRKTDDDLMNSFSNRQEKEICRSLLCWVNDGSHCISDDLHIEHHDVINDKFLDVFKNTFENMNHIDHYNMMMGIQPVSESTL